MLEEVILVIGITFSGVDFPIGMSTEPMSEAKCRKNGREWLEWAVEKKREKPEENRGDPYFSCKKIKGNTKPKVDS